jgi:hypothetical protein
MPSQRTPTDKFHSPKVAFPAAFPQVKPSMAASVLGRVLRDVSDRYT